jgi:hyperosmotically inducible periplasmic protein
MTLNKEIGIMSSKNKIMAMVPAMVLGFGLAIPAIAQDTSGAAGVPASTSMHQAGEDSGSAAQNAYRGAVTAVDDTTITAAVKTNLAAAQNMRSGQIHVTTTAGVVTLEGIVHDSNVASRAVAIAKDASGVRSVTNELQVDPSVPQS